MNSRKYILFFLPFLLALITFLLLSPDFKKKIIRKLAIPYQELYLSFVDVNKLIAATKESSKQFYNNGMKHGDKAYIAHGGGVGSFVYTNCREAIIDSINKGFRYIEIDLHETNDGDLVGIHDWDSFATRTGNKLTRNFRQLSTLELKKLKIDGKYTVLSSEDICEIMKQNPDIILVTDKIENFDILIKRIPFPDRMIVEVFSSYHYIRALEYGIKYPALSLCKKHWIAELEKYEFPLAVAPSYWFDDLDFVARVNKLHCKGVTFLVFGAPTCDNPDFIKRHLGSNISLIYSDTWYPKGSNPLAPALPDSNELDMPSDKKSKL